MYKVLDVVENKEKRDYNRVAESWRVRGHWRQYKSGKKVWIEEHTKGKKEVEQDTQEYKITRIDK